MYRQSFVRQERYEAKGDAADGLVEFVEWRESDSDFKCSDHPNCEVCGTIPKDRARLVKIDVPGGTVMHWSE
jgi:hypothetical protein